MLRPQETTRAAVDTALATIGPEAKLLAFHADIGQAVVQIPANALAAFKSAIGPEFHVDPRARLSLD